MPKGNYPYAVAHYARTRGVEYAARVAQRIAKTPLTLDEAYEFAWYCYRHVFIPRPEKNLADPKSGWATGRTYG